MNSGSTTRVIAVDPTHRGFGYVVFEGKSQLIDWGTVKVAGEKNPESLKRFEELAKRYEPDILVVEDYFGEGSRRTTRVKRLIWSLSRKAESRGMRVRRLSPVEMRKVLMGSRRATKEDLAAKIAARFPELVPYLPPHRRIWMSESLKMSVFDAAGLALAMLRSSEGKTTARAA